MTYYNLERSWRHPLISENKTTKFSFFTEVLSESWKPQDPSWGNQPSSWGCWSSLAAIRGHSDSWHPPTHKASLDEYTIWPAGTMSQSQATLEGWWDRGWNLQGTYALLLPHAIHGGHSRGIPWHIPMWSELNTGPMWVADEGEDAGLKMLSTNLKDREGRKAS